MSRRLILMASSTLILLSQGALAAWAADGSGSASDGGSSVSVGASSSTSVPGGGATGGVGGTGGAGGGSGPVCKYMPLPSQYAVPLGPGGPTPGAWYLVTVGSTQLGIGERGATQSGRGHRGRGRAVVALRHRGDHEVRASRPRPSGRRNLEPSWWRERHRGRSLIDRRRTRGTLVIAGPGRRFIRKGTARW